MELYNKELLKKLKDEIGETNYYMPKKLFENVMFRNIRLETKLAYVAILDVLLKKPTYNQENKALLKVDNPMIVKTLAILANKEVDQNKINKYLDELIEDYLLLAKIKPKRWWNTTLDKENSRKILHMLIKKYNLNQEDIFRYSIIEELENCYIIATYKNYQVTVNKYPKTS